MVGGDVLIRSLKVVLLLISSLVLLAACSEKEKLDVSNNSPEAEVSLTPVDLFQEEGAKFQPFLGSMSGAFKLSYEGKRPNAKLDIDIWQNGKVTSFGSIGDVFFSSGDRQKSEVEVIISIDTVSIGEGQNQYHIIKVGMIQERGSSLATYSLPWDNRLSARGLISNSEPRIFIANEPIHVWGMQATSSNEIHTADLSEESLNKLEWGLIFTLRFEK